MSFTFLFNIAMHKKHGLSMYLAQFLLIVFEPVILL